ncbi:MAG: ABC transporter substrate-binding protein [Spirochaetales bacterium]|nr:ABC transporter substrate-binding protein [Spirochaetales bacterium]
MKKIIATLLVVMLCSIAVFAQAAGESKKEITVLTACTDEEAIVLFEKFEADTGIHVNYLRMSVGEAVVRLEAEKDNPQFSLFVGGAVDQHKALAAKGLLDPYLSKNASNVTAREHLPADQMYTPFSAVASCIVSNKDWLKENGLEAPTSWAELITPAFKDNVTIAHPGTSGAAYTVLSTLCQLMGVDEAFAYLAQLDKNIVQYTKSGAAPIRMAGLGETGIAIGYDDDAKTTLKNGYNLIITYPSEGTGYEISCAALVKGGPAAEKANAQAFLDWILGESAQKLWAEELNRTPLNNNIDIPAGYTPFAQIKLVDLDNDWSAAHKAELVARFEEQIRSSANVKK